MSWGIVFRVRQYVKSSLWLAPLVSGAVGFVLADLGQMLEAHGGLPAAWHYSPETATAVLSATIGAIASLTGFVVTVTVLGVQMATGTSSPRYMRLWYRDGTLKLLLAAGGIQVVRRLRSLLDELRGIVEPKRRVAIDDELRRLDATVAAHLADSVDIDRAGTPDAQGIGGPTASRDPAAVAGAPTPAGARA